MATKLYDLSVLFGSGAAMWPRFAADMPCGAPNAFGGIRSTAWHNLNHPGWWDMGWPFPFNQGAAQIPWGHLHGGTHIDAPVYVIPSGTNADEIPLENLYGTGVVLDFRKKKKWEAITAADLEKATPKIQAGDFVVINTGWQTRWEPPGNNYEYLHTYPGLDVSAAEWLVKKKVKAIAGTWPSTDHSLTVLPLEQWAPWLYQDYKRETGKEPEKSTAVEPCITMLLKAGIVCIQNAGGEIDGVTGKRCTLCAWPYRLENADAAHVRLVAIVEE
jgi:kynurenine formamidase